MAADNPKDKNRSLLRAESLRMAKVSEMLAPGRRAKQAETPESEKELRKSYWRSFDAAGKAFVRKLDKEFGPLKCEAVKGRYAEFWPAPKYKFPYTCYWRAKC